MLTNAKTSTEDKGAALQQKAMQQNADHTRACLFVKYSSAAREFAKKRLHQHGVVEQGKARGAGFPTTGPNCLKNDNGQQIHHIFMCWGSVSAVH